MRIQLVYMIIISALLTGCGNPGNQQGRGVGERTDTIAGNSHAEKFKLEIHDGYTLATVFSPWQNAGDTRFRYVLADQETGIPDSLSEYPVIHTPVSSTILMSTTFISFLDTLGRLSTVEGVSGGENIFDPELYHRYVSGEIRDVGFDQAINFELLVEMQPDVVFMFGVQSGIVQSVNKLRNAGIEVVLCADYLEPHPLGRAEWIRFFSAFSNQEAEAEKIFEGIEMRYDSISGIQQEHPGSPKVMLGLPWKDAWYVAGAESYAARLIRDAGGAYVFSDHDHAEAKPFDIEAVFARAMEADIWINPGIAGNLEMITSHDQRFEKLNVFRNGRIYNNNKRIGPGGGNDYWESGALRPDRILEDLSAIFHDTVPADSVLFYYTRLQ